MTNPFDTPATASDAKNDAPGESVLASNPFSHPAPAAGPPAKSHAGPPGKGPGRRSPAPDEPPPGRRLDDPAATQKAVYASVLAAAQALPPVSEGGLTLRLANPEYVDPPDFSPKRAKAALLTGETLGRRMRGTWELVDDASGHVLDKATKVVARVPWLGERGGYLHRGNHYAVSNQTRLLGGAYARFKADGEPEVHVQAEPGQGLTHHLELDRAQEKLKLRVGAASAPLVPVLKAAGASEEELRDALGEGLYAANRNHEPAATARLRASVFRRPDATEEALAQRLAATRLTPHVSERTLGKPYATMDKDAMLAATRKLVALSRGEAEEDDRDDPAFQRFVGPEDLFAERLTKDHARIRLQALRKAARDRSLAKLPSGLLTPALEHVLLHSGLGSTPEEVNPLEPFDRLSRVTRMGEGGIGSTDAVPDSAREVRPTQFGVVDPVRTSESLSVGADGYVASSARKGDDGRLYAPYRDRDGRRVWRSPDQAAGLTVAWPGADTWPYARVPVTRGGKIDFARRDEVDLTPEHMEGLFSPVANLVPLKSAARNHRLAMAGRMFTQALPLAEPEAPLVQNAVPGSKGGMSYDDAAGGQAGAVRAGARGVVTAAGGGTITLRTPEGEEHAVELHENFPHNRKSFLHQTPVVRAGDRVEKGQLLARSNFTDPHGTLALGRNLRTAYLPWKGLTFEDAIAVSESAARLLTSEHAYRHDLPEDPKVTPGLGRYLGLFPGKHDRDVLAKLDKEGVVRPGQEVKQGDPLILAVREADRSGARIHRKGGKSYVDAAVTWDHDDPGVVTDVVRGKNGPVVLVKARSPLKVGDKLSGRHGNKGVVADVLPDERMPKGEDGRPYHVLVGPDAITTRGNPAQLVELALAKVARARGEPYKVEDFAGVPDLAGYARDELARHGMKPHETATDPETGNAIKRVPAGELFWMKLSHQAEGKEQGRGTGAYDADDAPAKGGKHGCFAPKQKIVTHLGPMDIARICEKRLGVQVRTFSERLQEWVYRPVTDWFVYRADVSDLLTVHTEGGACENESIHTRTRSCLYATKNHVVCTYDGRRVETGELTTADQLVGWGPVPTAHQWEFIYGTMLGDSCANHAYFGFGHSVKQAAYVAWKKSLVAGLSPQQCDQIHRHDHHPSFKTKRIKARHVWLSQDSVCAELSSACYDAERGKRVTPEWLAKLSDLSIAVWLLDDGSITNRAKKAGRVNYSGNIATHGFPAESREMLKDWLNRRLGTACVVNNVGAISLTADACRKLVEIVADWVPVAAIPQSKRFLRKQVAAIQLRKPPRRLDTVCRMGKVPLRISKIVPYRHDKPGVTEINVYDFTVEETHTYVAGHALVSNSKRLGLLNVNALISHGAVELLREKGIRGARRDEHWMQVMQGHTPREPDEPRAYQKFLAHLTAAGANPTRDGHRLHFKALAADDVDRLAGDRRVVKGDTVKAGSLDPVPGGLFDVAATGGHGGAQWSAISLPEPMPSPVMEDPLRRLLGLTQDGYEQVIAGQKELPGLGSGPGAVAEALKGLDLASELHKARGGLTASTASARDDARRRLGFLKGFERTGVHPRDVVWDKAPVLPPLFRPVSQLPGGQPIIADANYLYSDLLRAADNYKAVSAAAGGQNAGPERLAVYHALKAVAGLGDPVGRKSRDKQVKGLLSKVFGSSPKFSSVQRQLLGTTVDNVGRGVIVPNPDLDMDSIGLPKDLAFEAYKPHLAGRLVRKGMTVMDAVKAVEARTPEAERALREEMDARPVFADRAPVWHKYGVLGFHPRLVPGRAIHVSPLVVAGFNADFDGDTMQVHAPATDAGVRRALAMRPSQNLLSAADFRTPVFTPGKLFLGGLYHATTAKSQRSPRVYMTTADVRRALAAGEIDARDPVEVLHPD